MIFPLSEVEQLGNIGRAATPGPWAAPDRWSGRSGAGYALHYAATAAAPQPRLVGSDATAAAAGEDPDHPRTTIPSFVMIIQFSEFGSGILNDMALG